MPNLHTILSALRTRVRHHFEGPPSPELPTRALPVTMVGSYPRPAWFTYQLQGRDIQEAFKVAPHAEAFEDAVRAVLKDQERAGLDIASDGQMWFDDYGAGIGAFTFYWFERIGGFSASRHPHPLSATADGIDLAATEQWSAAAVTGPVQRGPLRLADLFRIAQSNMPLPVKFCVGAGPVNLCMHTQFDHYEGPRELAEDLAPIYNAEMRELVQAGCRFLQLEDMGVWTPTRTGRRSDFKWIRDVLRATVEGVKAKIALHFCFGNTWGSTSPGLTGAGYGAVLPELYELPIDQFVLDFACRDMADIDVLADLPPDKEVAAGVIDVRATEVEPPEQVADRIRRLLKVVSPERVTLTTDCGMKQLPRFTAYQKLRSLSTAAATVRKELGL